MLCREQFLKHPPANLNKCVPSPLPDIKIDDASNWQTEDEEDDSDHIRSSRRRRKRLPTQAEIDLRIMKQIYDAQTNEVKQVILSLHQMQMNQRKAAACEKRSAKSTAPRPLLNKQRNKTKQSNAKKKKQPKRSAPTAAAGTLQNNRKLMARLKRRRHFKRKPKKKQFKNRAKFPRRRRPRNAKSGNRQFRKRICRSQKLFNKGFLLVTGRKLMEQICNSAKDSNGNSMNVCDKNVYHGLSKLHLQQIAVYERIEEDLQRLSITREERTKAAEERKVKELEKAELREDLKNKLVARAAAHAEADALKKERRAVRKKRDLEKRLRQQTAKAEIRLYCKSVV